MTLKELEARPEEMLTAEQVAPLFNTDPHSIRLQAHQDPRALGFPVVVIGRRVHIPREGLINYCRAVGLSDAAGQ